MKSFLHDLRPMRVFFIVCGTSCDDIQTRAWNRAGL